MLRIYRKKGIKSTIKCSNNGCTRQAANPQFIAKNVLNRDFTAEAPNQKWLTNITEFKWYDENKNKHKVYLSAILDLYDRWIVTYVISGYNNNPLVFNMFDKAIAPNPRVTPLFTTRASLVKMDIEYYNTRRSQQKLGILIPFEKHEQYLATANCHQIKTI